MGARGKRVNVGRNLSQAGACLVALFLFAPGASFALDQERAQNNTGKLNYSGSNDSMDAATDSAMRAMMNLASLNIPGAFSNGYKAYGQYINSEKMDDVEIKALRRRSAMGSIGTAGVNTAAMDGISKNTSEGSSISGKPTSFSRMDPSYLYKGKTGDTATEFEKVSGMKRETFYKHLSGATDSDLSYDDPNLLQKLETRFEAFKAEVPNQDFKDGLDKAAALFPHEARVEALGRLSSMYADAWKDVPGQSALAAAPPSTESGAQQALSLPTAPAEFPAVVNATIAAEAANGRAPASASNQTDKDGVFIGIAGNSSQDMVNEFLSTPTSADTDTLFVKVSKRYRLLTPALLGRL